MTAPQPGGAAMLPRVLLLGFVAAIGVGGWIATCVLWRYQDAMREIGVLEARRFEAPTLVVLGSGGATENPARFGPALALGVGERVLLVDAGRGVAESLRRARIPMAQAELVLLTSLAPENTVGLDDLLSVGFRAGRLRPLRVLGPPGTRSLVRGLSDAHGDALAALASELGLPRDGAALEAEEIGTDDWSINEPEATLRAARLEGGPLPALAYRLESRGRSLVVASVGAGSDRLAELARGASVLVTGAVFSEAVAAAREAGVPNAARIEREAALQLSLDDAARLAARVGAGRLVLVRLQPPPLFDFQFERAASEAYAGEVVVAEDGDEIEL